MFKEELDVSNNVVTIENLSTHENYGMYAKAN
jgi:hypothetical protein